MYLIEFLLTIEDPNGTYFSKGDVFSLEMSSTGEQFFWDRNDPNPDDHVMHFLSDLTQDGVKFSLSTKKHYLVA